MKKACCSQSTKRYCSHAYVGLVACVLLELCPSCFSSAGTYVYSSFANVNNFIIFVSVKTF